MRFVKTFLSSLVLWMLFTHSASAKTLEGNSVVLREPILTPKAASESIICSGSFGGPNGYGYAWIDSDTTSGPTYNWIEISTIGTRIQDTQWHSPGPNTLDDGTAGPFPIGFSFPYNHSVFDSIYIGTNGLISFSDGDLTYDGYFYSHAHIPQMIFSNPLAAFWNDLSLDPNVGYGGGDIYYWTNSLDTFIVEYKNVKPYSDSVTSDNVTFQIILTKSDSCITFQYQSVVTLSTWFRNKLVYLDSSAVIGIQDQTKQAGLQYFNGDETGPWFTCYDNLPHSDLAIKFEKTLQIDHNLLVSKSPLDEYFYGNTYCASCLFYYIKEVGEPFDDNTVKVFNIGNRPESNFSVFCLISVLDSLGNPHTIDFTSVLVPTLLLSDDSTEVVFSNGWQPEARGFYLVTYGVAFSTDQFPSDDTTKGLLLAERTKFRSNWAQTVPLCDGRIESGEWDEAIRYDVSKFAAPTNIAGMRAPYFDSLACFAYIKNNYDYLYFAFDVPKDTHDTQSDVAALYLDDNGDGWFEADSSEGNFYVYNRIDAESDTLYFMAHVSTQSCYTSRIYIEHGIPDWEFAISKNNGRQQFEIAIPRGTDPKWELNFIPGDTLRAALAYIDMADSLYLWGYWYYGNYVAYWPAMSIFSWNPCKMGKIYLSQMGYYIRGNVRDNNGQPMKDSLVYLAGPETRTDTTDRYGNFLFACLPEGSYYVYRDWPCHYYDIYLDHNISGINFVGCTDVADISENEGIPKEYALFQNYPNPFNPQTSIQYDLPKETEVKLTIYNILGQKVKTLVDERQKAGHKQILWDGRNDKGKEVSSGIYFYLLKTPEFKNTKKMMLIK